MRVTVARMILFLTDIGIQLSAPVTGHIRPSTSICLSPSTKGTIFIPSISLTLNPWLSPFPYFHQSNYTMTRISAEDIYVLHTSVLGMQCDTDVITFILSVKAVFLLYCMLDGISTHVHSAMIHSDKKQREAVL